MNNNLFLFDSKKSQDKYIIIGTDEAGRGPGAGPVYSAAVYFPDIDKKLIKLLNKLNDSKQLTEAVREELYEIIIRHCVYSVQSSSVSEIEKMNILQASLLSMKRACEELMNQINNKNVKVLIDGNKLIPRFNVNQETIIKGDSKSAAIAAASILAKVSRDRFMNKLSESHPEYLWHKNKGYLTKEHLEAIDKYGITIWHRKKFLEKHFEKSEQMTLDLFSKS